LIDLRELAGNEVEAVGPRPDQPEHIGSPL
jgi:hypothetical protein